MKKRTYLLILLLALFCLAGCGGGNEPAETESPESPERPAQTGEDSLVSDDGIVKIEDETGTYEVVYAEGLKEIKMDEDTNVLVSADDENFIYTFENADMTLRLMDEGDVFCGVLPESGEAIAVVVSRVEKNGDTVTVYGVQPTLEDLFESIEIEATVGTEALILDELGEGVTVEDVENPELNSGQTSGFVNCSATAQNLAKSASIQRKRFSQGIDIRNGNIRVQGRYTTTIEKVEIEYSYSAKEERYLTSLTVHRTESTSVEVDVFGQAFQKDWLLARGRIPLGIPLLSVPIDLYIVVELEGEISGGVSRDQSMVDGAKIVAKETGGFEVKKIEERPEPKTDIQFSTFSGKLTFGGRVESRVGIEEIASAYIRATGGLRLHGTAKPWQDIAPDAEVVHDCAFCINGELNLFYQVDCGARLALRKRAPMELNMVLAEGELSLGLFYISFGPDGTTGPLFGKGECPYYRYRTEVNVYSDRGSSIGGAEVFAQYPDGRTDHQRTDEFGMAVFWLPAGQNWLDAEYNERVNGDYYTILEEPSRQEIELEFDQRVVVVCNFYKVDGEDNGDRVPATEFGEIYGKLTTDVSQAEIYSATTWEEYNNPILLYGGEEKKELRPGDILVVLSSNSGLYSGSRGYDSFTATVSMMVKPWHGKPEFRTIGHVSYNLELETASEFLPEVHWLTPGGEEYLLTGVYFEGFNTSGYLECTDFFDEISYSHDSGYWDSMPKVEYWSGREVLRTKYWEWDYTYQFIVNETVEETHYIEEHYTSWGDALISYSMDCLMPHIQRAIVH